MKLIRTLKGGFVFRLSPREKLLLSETVKFYPLVPASHHHLNKEGKSAKADENQRLLEESLAEHRAENRRLVLAMLDEPKRFRETKTGFELKLTHSEVEWLLQVLNDVRVGSWLALGEPEHEEMPEVTEENAKYYFALEISGLFQSFLLEALGVSEKSEWAAE